MNAGELFVKVGLDGGKEVNKTVGDLITSFLKLDAKAAIAATGIGAVGLAMYDAIKDTFTFGKALNSVARGLGMSAEGLQTFTQAYNKLTGANEETVFSKLQGSAMTASQIALTGIFPNEHWARLYQKIGPALFGTTDNDIKKREEGIKEYILGFDKNKQAAVSNALGRGFDDLSMYRKMRKNGAKFTNFKTDLSKVLSDEDAEDLEDDALWFDKFFYNMKQETRGAISDPKRLIGPSKAERKGYIDLLKKGKAGSWINLKPIIDKKGDHAENDGVTVNQYNNIYTDDPQNVNVVQKREIENMMTVAQMSRRQA